MPDRDGHTTSEKDAIKTPKIVVSFRIMEFTCSHHEITKVLGIQPTMTWSPGDRVRNTRLVRKENGWSIDINLEDATDWHEQVEHLLSEVHPFHQDLARLCGDYYAELACIFYIAGDERPEIHFTPQQLRKLADLHAHIDVDLYLLE
jgi:hypothetical protein